MTMNTKSIPIWARSVEGLKRFGEALDYDSTQYTFDRMKVLQQNIDQLAARVEHLEQTLAATSEAPEKQTANY